MADRLFGTDGIRDVAGRGKLAPARVLAVGRALGSLLGKEGVRAVVCRDTRRSGPMVRDALVAGLLAEGVDVFDAGVRPTPALPALARSWRCAFGAVISASHNPMEYNGIKVFGPDGAKLSDALEDAVAARMETLGPEGRTGAAVGRLLPLPAGADPYRETLAAALADLPDPRGRTVVLDCANGATFRDGPAVFERLGFRVAAIHAEPDGDNINEACGSLEPALLAAEVRRRGAFAGVALDGDGDGDRAVLADETGAVRDGDFVLAALAEALDAAGALPGMAVAGTVMTNLGLELFLKRRGIELVRAPVGDRHVAAAMIAGGLALGGEPSGHVIFRGPGGLRPGDGILTGLKVLEVALAAGRPLSALAADLEIYPQTLLNVPVKRTRPFEEMPEVARLLEDVRRTRGEELRVVLRYSGTEPVARVMVEGAVEAEVKALAERLAGLIGDAL